MGGARGEGAALRCGAAHPGPGARLIIWPCPAPRPQVHSIAGLPILDLALLVAAHRLAARGSEDFNFEMVRGWAGGAGVGLRVQTPQRPRRGRALPGAPPASTRCRCPCDVLQLSRSPPCNLQAYDELKRHLVRRRSASTQTCPIPPPMQPTGLQRAEAVPGAGRARGQLLQARLRQGLGPPAGRGAGHLHRPAVRAGARAGRRLRLAWAWPGSDGRAPACVAAVMLARVCLLLACLLACAPTAALRVCGWLPSASARCP